MNSINHYTIQRVIDVAANVEGRDLGSVAAEINKAIAEVQKGLPSTTKIMLRGQNEVMENSFRMLGFGLILAIILVYAVLVILFQSWIDPFIIMMAVPAALLGIIWMLVLHRHDHQRHVADGRDHGGRHLGVELDPGRQLRQRSALAQRSLYAVRGGRSRPARRGLRPVLMTALAMIMGMMPMALGPRRRRRAERAAWPRRHRRPRVRDLRDAAAGADFLHAAAQEPPALHTLDQRFAAEAAGASKEALGHG